MANTLRIRRRLAAGGAGAPPALANAELAFNEASNILYYGSGDNGGNATSILAIAGSGAFVDLLSSQTISGAKTFNGAVTMSGAPSVTVPTVTPSTDNSNKAASTAFVQSAMAGFGVGTVTSVALSLPNIFNVTGSPVTSSGTLTGTLANQSANTVFAGPPSGSAATPAFRSLVTNDIPTLTASKISDFDSQVRANRLDQMAVPTAHLNLNNVKITNLAAPTGSLDAVNKAYADSIAQSLNVHSAVDYATTGPVSYSYASGGTALTINTITGTDTVTFSADHALLINSQIRTGNTTTGTGLSPNATYYVTSVPSTNQVKVSATYGGSNAVLTNGTSLNIDVTGNPGVGATLSGCPDIVDGGSTLVVGQRILIKDHTTLAYNGIYSVSVVGTGANGVWTRAEDFDNFSTGEIASGDFMFVTYGATYGGNGFVQTKATPIRMGVSGAGYTTFTGDDISFTQFSGAGQIIAGNALVKNGNTLDVNVAAGRIVINSDAIDLATVSQSNTSGSAGINFVQSQAVDSYGRVTGTVTADVRAGSTTQTGILQLTDSTSSTSTTTAATPNSVKTAYDLAAAALPKAGGAMTGAVTLTASTSGGVVPLKFSQSAATPSAPVDGDFWLANDVFYYYNGSATKSLAFTDSNITGNADNVTGVVAAVNGGTGLSSYSVGDILYASGATALSKLTAVATGNVLISGGVTTAPSWGKVGLTTHVSGLLPLANGGTGADLSSASAGTIFKTNGSNMVTAVAGVDYLSSLSTIDGGTF